VPSLTVLLADNQKTIFQGLEKQNITLNLRIDDPDFEKHLKTQIQKILEPDRMQQLSNKSSQIINGLGADNVVQQLIQYHA
jgi:spore coat polysaccharide biosynthesis predicted glycosyltransferase SpsG